MASNSTQQTDTPTRRQTVQQQRAQFAWEQVADVPANLRAPYLGAVRAAPAMVIGNGLGPTLAFQLAKGGAYKALYEQLEIWLCDRKQSVLPSAGQTPPGKNRLVQRLLAQDSAHYRRATVETLALLEWLKRFAEATIEETSEHAGPE